MCLTESTFVSGLFPALSRLLLLSRTSGISHLPESARTGRGAEECFPFAARSPAASLTHSGGIPNMKRGSNTHGRMQVSAEKPGELNGTPLVFDVSELLGQLLQAGAMVHGTAAHAVPWGTAFSFLSLSCGVLS